jgi:hypothetical protein
LKSNLKHLPNNCSNQCQWKGLKKQKSFNIFYLGGKTFSFICFFCVTIFWFHRLSLHLIAAHKVFPSPFLSEAEISQNMQNFLKFFPLFKTFKHLLSFCSACRHSECTHNWRNRMGKGRHFRRNFPYNEIIRVEILLKSLKSFSF